MSKNARLGEVCFNKIDKVSSELFALTYGALVAQLVQDYEDVDQVNVQLEKMGYNIGLRLIDEFLSKTGLQRCGNFTETGDVIAKAGFRMFFGIAPELRPNNDKSFSLVFLGNNPLEEFVELPDSCKDLKYSNILAGVIRGALESVSMKVSCSFAQDVLCGDHATEIRVDLEEVMEDMAGEDYHED